MFSKILPVRAFLIGLLLVAGIGVVSYLVIFRGARSTVTQQILSKQQILVRAQTSNISSFFQAFGNSIAVFARRDSIKNLSPDAAKALDTFVGQWRENGLIGGIVLTDSQGIVQFNSNVLGTRDVGGSLADRDYFTWAKTNPESDQYFVGQPVISRLGASKGQTIIPVAAAVYKNGVLTGTVVASVELVPLAQKYLELMKVSDISQVYLISKQGELLYSNSLPDDAAGLDLFQYLEEKPFPGSQILSNHLKNVLSTDREGSLNVTYLNPKTEKIEEHLLSYSPISLGPQEWLLVMSSPLSEVSDVTVPIYLRLTALFVLITLSIFAFGIISAREVKNQKSL